MFWHNTQTLLNKLMSRNYHEFQFNEKIANVVEQAKPLKVQEEIPEDMAQYRL